MNAKAHPCEHVWAWESDRELCTICGDERPSQESIHDLLAEQERLEMATRQIVAAADKLCDMASAVWMDEALEAANELQALLRHVDAADNVPLSDSYKEARGALPRLSGEDRAEVAIRRLRGES